jgi:hypothetical protein
MASLPDGYCQGLGAIVLTRTDLARARQGRRQRANRKGIALGTYHPRRGGQLPWIELMVDEIVKGYPQALMWIRPFRDLALGRVLFHEIGHHLDATNRSVGRTGEHGAIAWERRLSRAFVGKTYGYLRPLAPMFAAAYKFTRMVAARERHKGREGRLAGGPHQRHFRP